MRAKGAVTLKKLGFWGFRYLCSRLHSQPPRSTELKLIRTAEKVIATDAEQLGGLDELGDLSTTT